jgi:hypothetical protein
MSDYPVTEAAKRMEEPMPIQCPFCEGWAETVLGKNEVDCECGATITWGMKDADGKWKEAKEQ